MKTLKVVWEKRGDINVKTGDYFTIVSMKEGRSPLEGKVLILKAADDPFVVAQVGMPHRRNTITLDTRQVAEFGIPSDEYINAALEIPEWKPLI